MDTTGFRGRLQSLGLDDAQINSSIALAARFEAFVASQPPPPTMATAWAFSRQLIDEGTNTRANYVALVRYCRFIGSHEMYVALVELVDGGEVDENLFRLIGEKFGLDFRDEVFGGIGVIIDHDMPLYYTRAKVAEVAFGDARYHREAVIGRKLEQKMPKSWLLS